MCNNHFLPSFRGFPACSELLDRPALCPGLCASPAVSYILLCIYIANLASICNSLAEIMLLRPPPADPFRVALLSSRPALASQRTPSALAYRLHLPPRNTEVIFLTDIYFFTLVSTQIADPASVAQARVTRSIPGGACQGPVSVSSEPQMAYSLESQLQSYRHNTEPWCMLRK